MEKREAEAIKESTNIYREAIHKSAAEVDAAREERKKRLGY